MVGGGHFGSLEGPGRLDGSQFRDIQDISSSGKGEIVVKYKPTYSDKQREAQKQRKDEELRNRQVEIEKKQVSDEPQKPENPPREKERIA